MMTRYNIYPDFPKEPSAPPQTGGPATPQSCHLNVIQSKQEGLLGLEEMHVKKYSKYSRILDRLVWLNTCLSGLSIASRISSVATLITFIGLPVSIPLDAVFLDGASISIVTAAPPKSQNWWTS